MPNSPRRASTCEVVLALMPKTFRNRVCRWTRGDISRHNSQFQPRFFILLRISSEARLAPAIEHAVGVKNLAVAHEMNSISGHVISLRWRYLNTP